MYELPVTRPLSSTQCILGMPKGKHDAMKCWFYSLSTFTAFNRVRNKIIIKNSMNEDSSNAWASIM